MAHKILFAKVRCGNCVNDGAVMRVRTASGTLAGPQIDIGQFPNIYSLSPTVCRYAGALATLLAAYSRLRE